MNNKERPYSLSSDFVPLFYDKTIFNTFEAAQAAGAVREGELCYGYTSAMDSICNVHVALELLGRRDEIGYRMKVNGEIVSEEDL